MIDGLAVESSEGASAGINGDYGAEAEDGSGEDEDEPDGDRDDGLENGASDGAGDSVSNLLPQGTVVLKGMGGGERPTVGKRMRDPEWTDADATLWCNIGKVVKRLKVNNAQITNDLCILKLFCKDLPLRPYSDGFFTGSDKSVDSE